MEAHKQGMARAFFDHWFVAINNDSRLPRLHDKKLSVLALCALMEMAPAAVPEPLRDGWFGIVGGALRIFKTLPKAIEGTFKQDILASVPLTVMHLDRKKLEQSLEGEDESEDDVDEQGLNLEGDDGRF